MSVAYLGIFGSIPSPSSEEFSIGPFDIRYYGIMIAVGVLALIWISGARLQRSGYNPDLAFQLAWVTVPSGIIGARIYHLITDWDEYGDRIGDIYKIQEGGLGIPGAVIGAGLGLWGYAHYKKIDVREILDVVVPIVPLAQAIGRLGNWFNQELYGKPSDLPWAVEIDPENRVSGYRGSETFHPFFLYEALWSLLLMAGLLMLARKKVLKRGQMLPVYVLGYTSARIGLEFLRIDFANEVLGLRINVWVMSGFWLMAAAWLVLPKIIGKQETSYFTEKNTAPAITPEDGHKESPEDESPKDNVDNLGNEEESQSDSKSEQATNPGEATRPGEATKSEQK